MKNGQRQQKQPTKKESVKIRARLITEMLEDIRGRILDITDDYDNKYVPLNLLGVELKAYQFKDDDMVEFKQDKEKVKEKVNEMMFAIYDQAKAVCKRKFLNDKLSMEDFDIIIDFWIAATAVAVKEQNG